MPDSRRIPGSQSPDSEYVVQLAAGQEEIYGKQPIELIGHYNHEKAVADAYRGRQVLELLQNADDAGEAYAGERRFLFRLSDSYLVAANTGEPFSRNGIRSLVISDVSPKQLSPRRFIGNKGLGFRAVLTWSTAPLVLSGQVLVAFSPEHAQARAIELARVLPELHDEFERRREAKLLPVPTMRFPYVPNLADERVQIALSVRDEGYDTVIVLPLPGGTRGGSIRNDITAQLEALTGETLLFCRRVEQVRVDGDGQRTWKLRRAGPEHDQTVTIEHAGEVRGWRVRRQVDALPVDLIDEEIRDTPEFEIAVAVPQEPLVGESHKLCVHFPTDDGLPMALLAHATLSTDDSRKRLIHHRANRYILARLADFIAWVAEEEASRDSHRALNLLSGVESCDPELRVLGFLERLISACGARRLFPRLDGTMGTADDVRLPHSAFWPSIAPAEQFPELLPESAFEGYRPLLSALGLSWYDDATLTTRLERWVGGLPPQEAGLVAGRLLAVGALPKGLRPAILHSTAGVLPSDHTAYLPAQQGDVPLPVWVRNFGFLDARFAEALREALGVGSVRDTRIRLRDAGYPVEEFQVEGVARHLQREAKERMDSGEVDTQQLCRDVFRCVYQLGAAQEDAERGDIRVPLNVLTTRGTVRRASECYLGPAYPGGQLVHALYGPLDADEFVAAPERLGVHPDTGAVERFLVRLGVARFPRELSVESSRDIAGLSGFVDYILGRLEYPTSLFGQSYKSAKAAKQGLYVTFDGLTVPDRFAEALERGLPEAVVAYLLTDGHAHLTAGERSGATFEARQGREQNPRRYPAVCVPDAAYYLLRTVPWVPCDDGSRKTPDRVILSRTGRRVLGAIFVNHVLDSEHRCLRSVGAPGAIQSVLGQLGAVYSMDSLRADDLYRLLMALPERDAEGVEAERIYRAILESPGLDTDSPLRTTFVREGKMWGHRGDQRAYFPVSELRYAARSSLPAPVLERVALVAVDPRRSTREVERVFGVSPLGDKDFRIELEEHATEYQPWSTVTDAHVHRAVPYLFAYRLSRTTDDAGREAGVLRAIQLHVCRRISTLVTVFGLDPERVALEADLDGLVLKRQRMLLLVSHEDEMPADPVFWRAVGELLADAIEVASAASEFAQLLGCPSVPAMQRLLDRMTDGLATDLLEDARRRLAMQDEEQLFGPVQWPEPAVSVPPSTAAGKPGNQAPSPDAPAPVSSAVSPDAEFRRVTSPEHRAPTRRALVIARKVEPAESPWTRSVRLDEAESLDVVLAFEQFQGRFPLRVEHLRGSESLGCDIVSLRSESALRQAETTRELDFAHILRLVEVKGRSNRTGAIELSENQREAAQRFGSRYFLYRVYRNPARPEPTQLAILQSPIGSPAENVRYHYQYTLTEPSGAEWFELMPAAPVPETPADSKV
jgi:hypothetical protein